ncbi:alcohol dehydrogenase catalytic domain-containing protein [Amycolatopsis sp. NPDC051903]|uniref:alcohol dehydrogenase catalytic domain-containing protein n=1 Tax=Amycolatopsis sp. NPDC051903 TaxID=3363936 RepID=UPI0037A6AD6C
MRAITVRDRDAGVAKFTPVELPYPRSAETTSSCGSTPPGLAPGELCWPATWTGCADRDRTPSVPGHELSGVVAELAYGTTGLSVGQRVFGMADAGTGARARRRHVRRCAGPRLEDVGDVDVVFAVIGGGVLARSSRSSAP